MRHKCSADIVLQISVQVTWQAGPRRSYWTARWLVGKHTSLQVTIPCPDRNAAHEPIAGWLVTGRSDDIGMSLCCRGVATLLSSCSSPAEKPDCGVCLVAWPYVGSALRLTRQPFILPPTLCPHNAVLKPPLRLVRVPDATRVGVRSGGTAVPASSDKAARAMPATSAPQGAGPKPASSGKQQSRPASASGASHRRAAGSRQSQPTTAGTAAMAAGKTVAKGHGDSLPRLKVSTPAAAGRPAGRKAKRYVTMQLPRCLPRLRELVI